MIKLIFFLAFYLNGMWAQSQVHRTGQACTHYHAASDINSGVLADSRISQSSVTQHQNALSLTQSQVTNLITALAAKQDLNAHLTTISGLSPLNDDVLQKKAGAWTNRTPAQLKTDLAIVAGDVGSGTFADARIAASNVTQHQASLTLTESQITNLISDLAAKQALNGNLTIISGLSPSNDDVLQRKAGAWTNRTLAQLKTDLAVDLVTNTSDANKPVSTAQQTALDIKSNLAGPTFTGTVSAPTPPTGDNTVKVATTAFVQAASDYGSYQTILEASASHTAAKVAGTYALGDGDPAAVSGTGTLNPIKTIYIAAADYPSVDGKAAKLRLRVQLYVNDVAPTGNYTFGLYPITRPGTSGGVGLNIYTLGTVVGSSTVLFTAPAVDGLLNGASSDFALPSDGHYVLGFISTATVAASSHLHMTAHLQKRNN